MERVPSARTPQRPKFPLLNQLYQDEEIRRGSSSSGTRKFLVENLAREVGLNDHSVTKKLPPYEVRAALDEALERQFKRVCGKERIDFDAGGDIQFLCVVCHGSTVSGSGHHPCALPCGHVFGLHCITKWLERNDCQTCPVCTRVAEKGNLTLLYGTAVRDDVDDYYKKQVEKWRKKEEEWVAKEKYLNQRIEVVAELNRSICNSMKRFVDLVNYPDV